jgi:hypothetical protein
MKTRNGFVSNSSSSSFIIGYAVIKDRKRFENYCNKNLNLDTYGLKLFDSYFDLTSEDRILTGGNETEMLVPQGLDYNNPILTVQITNDEGDSRFISEDGFDLNYKQAEDISFYSEKQQAIIKIFEQPFVGVSKIIFGAERNG